MNDHHTLRKALTVFFMSLAICAGIFFLTQVLLVKTSATENTLQSQTVSVERLADPNSISVITQSFAEKTIFPLRFASTQSYAASEFFPADCQDVKETSWFNRHDSLSRKLSEATIR